MFSGGKPASDMRLSPGLTPGDRRLGTRRTVRRKKKLREPWRRWALYIIDLTEYCPLHHGSWSMATLPCGSPFAFKGTRLQLLRKVFKQEGEPKWVALEAQAQCQSLRIKKYIYLAQIKKNFVCQTQEGSKGRGQWPLLTLGWLIVFREKKKKCCGLWGTT